jgi:hypothetical protein
MTKVKMQGPDHFGGFSHAGESFVADEDGVVEVPPTVPNEVLAAHGLKPAAARVLKVLVKEDAPKAVKGKLEKVAADETGDEAGKTAEAENVKPVKEDAPKAVKGAGK